MNIRKEIRKTIREQAEMDSVDATEAIEEIRNNTFNFIHEMSDKITKMRSYFHLTDKNYGTNCYNLANVALDKLSETSDAVETLVDELYSADSK
jgi:hypothetical protein